MGSETDNGVVVVGGGVTGLTTAVVLAERGVRVRLWTRDPVGATTSAVAGALWWPYRIDPPEAAQAWALESLGVYEEMALRPEATGVRMVEGVLGETPMDEVGGGPPRGCRGCVRRRRRSTRAGGGCGRGCRWSTCRRICPICGTG